MHQHVDDDLELPWPNWIQKTAAILDKDIAQGYTTPSKVRRALDFLGMIEVDDFLCPIPEINQVTGRITFVWPGSKGVLSATIQEQVCPCRHGAHSRCIISFKANAGNKIRKVGGPTLLRQELVKHYPFLEWRWDRSTLQ